MALPSAYLINAIRKTADNIESGERYSWAHMGSCNCGHLAQVLTGLTAAEIHERALQKEGDWSRKSDEFTSYCPSTGFHIDYLIGALVEAGLNPSDIRDLEHLDNRDVLKSLPGGFRYLKRNDKRDVVLYIRTWAAILEASLGRQIDPESVQAIETVTASVE